MGAVTEDWEHPPESAQEALDTRSVGIELRPAWRGNTRDPTPFDDSRGRMPLQFDVPSVEKSRGKLVLTLSTHIVSV